MDNCSLCGKKTKKGGRSCYHIRYPQGSNTTLCPRCFLLFHIDLENVGLKPRSEIEIFALIKLRLLGLEFVESDDRKMMIRGRRKV